MEIPAAPFFYDNVYWTVQVHRRNQTSALFLSEAGTLVERANARQFPTESSAQHCISRQRQGFGLFEIVQVNYRLGPLYPLPDCVTDKVEQIPPPYVFAVLNWYEGRDVKSDLLCRSRTTYYRYRKMLLRFGIDISRISKVVMLRT